MLRFFADIGNIGLAILWIFLIYIGNKFRVPVLADWAKGLPF